MRHDEEEELVWFDNPRRKRRRKLYGAAAAAHRKRLARGKRKHRHRAKAARHRSSPKRRKSSHRRRHVARRKLFGAAAKAHARRLARGGYKGGSHRKRRRSSSGRKRRWRRTSRATARRAGRQLRYRRSNPPFTPRGILRQVTSGAIDAAEVIAGKAVARYIPTLANLPASGALGLAVQVAAALAAGYVGRFISPNASKMMLAGGLAAPIESYVKSLNLPIISAALGDGEGYYAVGAWPAPAAISGYPVGAGVGDADDATDGVYGY